MRCNRLHRQRLGTALAPGSKARKRSSGTPVLHAIGSNTQNTGSRSTATAQIQHDFPYHYCGAAVAGGKGTLLGFTRHAVVCSQATSSSRLILAFHRHQFGWVTVHRANRSSPTWIQTGESFAFSSKLVRKHSYWPHLIRSQTTVGVLVE